MISARKANREGQTLDVVADHLFRLKICSRLHLRLETQPASVRYAISAMNEERGEKSNSSVIMMGDRGYTRP